ncbi:MAG TPA: hypothetical protein VJP80_07035 [Candidatus Saccharimonadales bacterium]|nr:hypothetical protein [Candidatus Saccharimonadales bacterium]
MAGPSREFWRDIREYDRQLHETYHVSTSRLLDSAGGAWGFTINDLELARPEDLDRTSLTYWHGMHAFGHVMGAICDFSPDPTIEGVGTTDVHKFTYVSTPLLSMVIAEIRESAPPDTYETYLHTDENEYADVYRKTLWGMRDRLRPEDYNYFLSIMQEGAELQLPEEG